MKVIELLKQLESALKTNKTFSEASIVVLNCDEALDFQLEFDSDGTIIFKGGDK